MLLPRHSHKHGESHASTSALVLGRQRVSRPPPLSLSHTLAAATRLLLYLLYTTLTVPLAAVAAAHVFAQGVTAPPPLQKKKESGDKSRRIGLDP